MQRSKGDLWQEIKALGLESTIVPSYPEREGGRDVTVEDLLLALQIHHGRSEHPLYKRFPDWTSPMLAEQIYNVRPEKQVDVWESSDYWFQTKLDGVRLVVIWTGGKWHAYGRGLSVETFLPIDYARNIWMFQDDPATGKPRFAPFPGEDFVIDCEVMSRNSTVDTGTTVTVNKLQATVAMLGNELNIPAILRLQELDQANLDLHVFDFIYSSGQDLRSISYEERWARACTLINHIDAKTDFKALHSNIQLVETFNINSRAEKEKFYSLQLSLGQEGCIAKDKTEVYRSIKNRSAAWVKLKKTVTDYAKSSFGMDYIDSFVVGFELGKAGKKYAKAIKRLHLAVWLTDHVGNNMYEDPTIIAVISNFDDATIADMTVTDEVTKEVTLNPKYMGRCVEVTGQDVSPRNRHLTHAKMVMWRDDRTSFDCKFPYNLLSFHRDAPISKDF